MTLLRGIPLLIIAGLMFGTVACDTSSTTDGRPNRGGKVTVGEKADEQRGGTISDWNQGTGAPGSAPSPMPTHTQVKSSSGTERGKAGQVGSESVNKSSDESNGE